jgi:glycosyltransferase involved in cell wall biosynthesis
MTMDTPTDGESLLTVVIPLYNEGESLASFGAETVEYCRQRGWSLVFINDGSEDNSKDILDAVEDSRDIKIVHHKVNRGYGGALKSGIRLVTTPFLVTLDGDGQHSLEDIDKIFQFALENDADMVVGRRAAEYTSSPYRTLGKTIIRSFTKILMPLPITDLNSGFKFYQTELAQRYITVCPDSMAFSDVITLVFLNERNLVLEHPISVSPRRAGQSSIDTLTAFETVLQVLNITLMFNPLRIFLPISIACILAGLAWGIPIILLGRGVSVGAMLAIVTGLLFFVLGLLASQLSAIRMERLREKSGQSSG